jgi:hypothetical protein
MREVLKDRFESIPVQVPRSEIEALGVEIGLEDPLEAARVFDRLKGVSWRGDYVRSEEGWVAAWVREVVWGSPGVSTILMSTLCAPFGLRFQQASTSARLLCRLISRPYRVCPCGAASRIRVKAPPPQNASYRVRLYGRAFRLRAHAESSHPSFPAFHTVIPAEAGVHCCHKSARWRTRFGVDQLHGEPSHR